MGVFMSYSSRDREAVKRLTQDLQDTGEQVWMDQRLAGGEAWWRAILDQIRGCDVFVFALSQNSIQSKPCTSELGYAQALGLPILPVQVGHVDSMHLTPVFMMQAVDYRSPTTSAAMKLIAALHGTRARRQPLPSPLPPEPQVPFEYLYRLHTIIAGSDQLNPMEQAALLAQLQAGLREDGGHDAARSDIVTLLIKLRDRGDVTYRTRIDVETALAELGALPFPSLPAPSPQPSPAVPARSSPRSYTAPTELSFAAHIVAGVAVDSGEALYITDDRDNRVLKLPAGSASPHALPISGLERPQEVAVDAAGTLYVIDHGADQFLDNDGHSDAHNLYHSRDFRVLKVVDGSTRPQALPFTDLNRPSSMAVDSAGTLYVVDGPNDCVLRLAADSAIQEVLPFTDLDNPAGVAVDSAGTLYVADFGNDRVLKLAAGSTTQEVVPFTDLRSPLGVAVDSAGTLYVTDFDVDDDPTHCRVLKLAADLTTEEVLPFTDLRQAYNVAVDSSGTVYVFDCGGPEASRRLLKLARR